MSTRLADLPYGVVDQLHRQLASNLTAEEGRKLHDRPELWKVMVEALRRQIGPKLVHGRFTPLADKIAMVKTWPGINPADVDAAFATAMENGTIAGYEAEVGKNPFLDIVVTVYRESIPATVVYARERMREVWGDKYSEWEAAYAQDVDDDRVKAIPGAKQFTPNRIVIEVVDFGANWNLKDGVVLEEVQKSQAAQLASFAVIYNAVQSPKWLWQMDGKKVPYALVAALLLNVPNHRRDRETEEMERAMMYALIIDRPLPYEAWRYSPSVLRDGGEARLSGDYVGCRFHNCAVPVLREYKR